jgi:hypothetical protein
VSSPFFEKDIVKVESAECALIATRTGKPSNPCDIGERFYPPCDASLLLDLVRYENSISLN